MPADIFPLVSFPFATFFAAKSATGKCLRIGVQSILIWPSSAFCYGPPRQRTATLIRAKPEAEETRWTGEPRWSCSEQIRREYEFGVGTITGVAQKLGVHRRMVREAIGSALPKPRKERPRWKLKAAVDFVDAVLEADRKAPRKQRHTAHRSWERIQHELPDCKIGERTVRQSII
jgi:hypothetical protein